MRDTRYGLLTYSVAAVLVLAVSCTGNSLDDGDSPNVVLEVQDVTIPPVQAAEDQTTGACTFTITEATATLLNIPKSELADTSPFNDVTIESITMSYQWDDGYAMTPYTTTLRVSIPADGSNQVRFFAVQSDPLLTAVPSRDGHSCEVSILFRGVLVGGSAIQARGGGALVVNSCISSGG